MNTGIEHSDREGEVRGDRLPVLFFDPTTVLYVSLFLILFAFFAALNTRADQQSTHASEIMLSLGQTFGGGSALVLQDARVSHEGDVESSAGAVGRAETLMVEVFPSATVVRSSRRVEMLMSLDGFFLAKQAKLVPSRELFIKNLAEAMTISASEPLLEIGLPRDAIGVALVQRRAALLAQIAEKYGVPADRIRVSSVGVSGSNLRLAVEVDS